MSGRRSTLFPKYVRCPKCGANAHATRIPQFRAPPVAEIRCMICGTRRYGDEAERIITEAIEAERAKITERDAVEATMRQTPPVKSSRLPRSEVVAAARSIASREQLMPTSGPSEPHTVTPSRRDTPAKIAKVAARATRVAELGGDASTLCESPWCVNPHPPDRRYCSKKCSDNVARERYDARKAKGKTP